MRWQITFLVISLMIRPQANLHSQQSHISEEIAKIIRHEANIDFTVVPGILVGVIDGDSTYICSYGATIQTDDIFELGSITKPFIAWLAKQALDSLGWSPDTSVCAFLPDSICQGEWEGIMVDQVLKHQIGLVRFPPTTGESPSSVDPYHDYDAHRLSKDIMQMKPMAGKYRYSHVGYAMLNWLFEKVGGLESFTLQVLSDSFTCTGWSFSDAEIAQGHGLDGRKQPPWHFKSMAPAMGLRSCMKDILYFLDLISPALGLRTPELTTSITRELKALAKENAYMLVEGWFLIESGADFFYYHTGRTGGHQVSIAFMPHKRKGVVVISNGALGSNELSLLVLNMVNHAKTKK